MDDTPMTRPVVHDGEHQSVPRPRPSFLTLPVRTPRPRTDGISHVLDNGLSLVETQHRLESAGAAVDVWKFGWGTAYLDPALHDKLDLLSAHGVRACTGGTLLEISWLQGATAPFMDWAQASGFDCMEVSCGSVTMPRDVKSAIIAEAAERFVVLAEVGTKDPQVAVSADQWADDAAADIAAGATWVVTEGRDSGTVGMFESDGSVRTEIVDTLVERVGLERLLFEAPLKSQQAWLIRRFGANVNLGNINPFEALSVEALRLGLRSDTIGNERP